MFFDHVNLVCFINSKDQLHLSHNNNNNNNTILLAKLLGVDYW